MKIYIPNLFVILFIGIFSNNKCICMPTAGAPVQSTKQPIPITPIATIPPVITPTTPTPAPITPVAIMPPVKAVTSPVTIIPATQAQVPVTPISIKYKLSPEQKKAANQVSQIMEKINILKDELKSELRKLDEKLHTARINASQAKKQSFEILRKDSEREARDIYDKIKENLNIIKNTQNEIQGEFSRNFNKKIADIKVHMATLQANIKNLETQRIKSLEYQKVPVSIKAVPGTPVKKVTTKAPKTYGKTFLAKGLDILSDATVHTIKLIKKAKTWLLEAKPPESIKKKTKQIIRHNNPPTPGMPGIPQKTSPMGKITKKPIPSLPVQTPRTTQEVRQVIAIFDIAIKQLEVTSITFRDSYQQIKQSRKALITQVQKYKEVIIVTRTEKIKKWKNAIVHIFSKLLDLIILTVQKTIFILKKSYNILLAPIVNKFSKDVKTKLQEMESSKKPSPPHKPAAPTKPQATGMPGV